MLRSLLHCLGRIPTTIWAAIIVGLCAVIAAVIGYVAVYRTPANITIDDAWIKDRRADAVIDVSIRNDGERTAFLTQAKIHVDAVYPIAGKYVWETVLVSENYDICLGNNEKHSIIIRGFSHEIKPDETDRVTFTIGSETAVPTIYLIRVDFIYNCDKTASTYPLMMLILPKRINGFHLDGIPQSERASVSSMLTEISQFRGYKSEATTRFLYYLNELLLQP